VAVGQGSIRPLALHVLNGDRPVTAHPPLTGDARPPLLSLEAAEVVYGGASLAVSGVSFTVPEHGVVALLGANGAGKTSIIRAISGLLGVHGGVLREGDVLLDGRSIRRLRPDRVVARGIAQVPEGRLVFSHLTVDENLRVGASARRAPGRVSHALEQVYELFPRIADRRSAQAGLLSGGEQQMVAIGRALMASPRLLLLDEVSLGLAPKVVESIFERLGAVRRELGAAMLMVEQNAQMALDFADQGYIMENGRVVLAGPSAALRANPLVQETYLGISARSEAAMGDEPLRARRRKRWLI
jgi:branched-chain amino acid transport system ATP-binding protein